MKYTITKISIPALIIISLVFINAPHAQASDIQTLRNLANSVYSDDYARILDTFEAKRNLEAEQRVLKDHFPRLMDGGESQKTKEFIINFIAYGNDEQTASLGAGERAAVIYSFKKAHGRLPNSALDFFDVFKIANGRYPGQRSDAQEFRAKETFSLIYNRHPNMNQPNDAAAVMVLAYGLRQQPENRNLKAELQGIAIFRRIFNQNPYSTEEWNMVQTIAYSGAKR